MKSIEEILDNYSEYETFLDDRFGRRFADFLTDEQVKKIGFEIKDEFPYIRFEDEETVDNLIRELKEIESS